MKRIAITAVTICLLAACLFLLPNKAQAATVAEGTCGDDLTWVLESTGTLTISGTGTMTDWSYNSVPWYSRQTSIRKVVVCDGVISIGDYAFAYCSRLTSVTIPDSVTAIGDFAFSGCCLSKVNIGNGVTSIGYNAFNGCTSLTSITIPNSVTSIGGYAFSSCTGLTTVNIGNGVTSFGNYAFSSCTGLTTVNIGNGVTSIGENAFRQCTSLKSVTIPDSVTTIGFYAFSGCTGLSSVTLGSGVSSMGSSTFSGCTGLVGIWVDENNEHYSSDSNGLLFDKNKTALIQVPKGFSGSCVIPDGVTRIGDSAFGDCTKLTSVTIPDSVNSIGVNVFSRCSSLESITIPFVGDSRKTSSDTYQYPFGYLFGSSSFTGGVYVDQCFYYSSNYSTSCITYCIPATLKSVTVTGGNILYGAFYNCSGLTSVTIGDGVTKIVEGAFYGCSSLESMTIPFVGDSYKTTSDYYQYPFGYIFGTSSYTGGTAVYQSYRISSKTYYIPTTLKSVTVTGGNILYGAFYNCAGLTSVIIPDSATGIGDYAFYNCAGLTSFLIPQSITEIGTHAFQRCSSLTAVTIPEGVSIIKASAFDLCSGLTELTIPDSVTVIEDSAFYSCTSLTSLTIGDGLVSIGLAAFHNCSSLTSVAFPASLTAIGQYAFRYCDDLTSVMIPNGVTQIGEGAFYHCTGLQKIMFTGNAPSIGSDTFNKVTATAYHPAGDPTWTTNVRQNYGGTITWIVDEGRIDVGGNVYMSLAEAIGACGEGQYLVLRTNAVVDAELTKDLYIDLNGFDLIGTIITNGYKVYGMDSTTDGYTSEAIGYMNLVDENGKEINPVTHFKSGITGETKRYIAIKDNSGYSFHRFYIGITHQSLKPTTVGVGYKAVFYGDSMVAANLDSFGFTMQLGNYTPKTATKDASGFVSGKTMTLRIDNFDVDNYGTTNLYAAVMLKLSDGTVIESTQCAMTMRSLLETLNTNYTALKADQLTAVANLIKKYAIISTWKVENLI